MAGNWDCGQAVKSMAVYWDGAVRKAFAFDTTGDSATHMGWKYELLILAADSPTSSVTFADITPDDSICGATLDNVSLRAIG